MNTLTQNLVDFETKARQRIENTRIALMKEGFEKERAEAQQAFEQEKTRIAKEEQERLQLYERLRKAGGKVTPGQKGRFSHRQRPSGCRPPRGSIIR